VDPLGPLAALAGAAVRRFVRATRGISGKGRAKGGRVAVARRDLRIRLEALGGAIEGSARPAPRRVGGQRRDWQALARQARSAIAAELKAHSLWWGLGAVLGALVVAAAATVAMRPAKRIPAPVVLGPGVSTQARQPSASGEIAPPAGATAAMSLANVRYCVFQQIRLSAVRPVTNGDDLALFNSLIGDWNARCARPRYTSFDKEAVDSEAIGRRAALEAEGRVLISTWRRRAPSGNLDPAGAGDMPSRSAFPPVLPVTNNPTAVPPGTPASASAESLPPLITQGRSSMIDIDPDSGLALPSLRPSLKPSTQLLRSEAAARVQQRLTDLGYVIKPADGTWGSTSRVALRRFKAANGLLRDDAFDAETATRLFSVSAVQAPGGGPAANDDAPGFEAAYPPPPGARMNPLNRADCQSIQRRLADLGYYSGGGDGLWGTASRNALRDFKVMNGLPDDDEWDAATEVALRGGEAVRASEVIFRRAAQPVPVPQPRPQVAPKPQERGWWPMLSELMRNSALTGPAPRPESRRE
jgi:peptidoglycan hydrolase-like protein with peptidoglycan-binding domain